MRISKKSLTFGCNPPEGGIVHESSAICRQKLCVFGELVIIVNWVDAQGYWPTAMPHLKSDYYWWIGCLRWPIRILLGGLEQCTLPSIGRNRDFEETRTLRLVHSPSLSTAHCPVDATIASLFLADPPTSDSSPVRNVVDTSSRGVLCYPCRSQSRSGASIRFIGELTYCRRMFSEC